MTHQGTRSRAFPLKRSCPALMAAMTPQPLSLISSYFQFLRTKRKWLLIRVKGYLQQSQRRSEGATSLQDPVGGQHCPQGEKQALWQWRRRNCCHHCNAIAAPSPPPPGKQALTWLPTPLQEFGDRCSRSKACTHYH